MSRDIAWFYRLLSVLLLMGTFAAAASKARSAAHCEAVMWFWAPFIYLGVAFGFIMAACFICTCAALAVGYICGEFE